MSETLRVKVDALHEEPYPRLLCYPRPEPRETLSRIEELRQLGVESIEFTGEKLVDGVRVLGKGCIGLVMKANTPLGPVALKVRRVDADRRDMAHESDMLRLANTVRVGPRLYASTANFILMEFVDGLPLFKWVEDLRGRGRVARVRKVLSELLDECFKLDEAGLDHGELSHAPKNVLVTRMDVPVIVDFESASSGRRPSNVTSISQYFLVGGAVAKKIRGILGLRRRQPIIEALRAYKSNRSDENLLKIKRRARLTS